MGKKKKQQQQLQLQQVSSNTSSNKSNGTKTSPLTTALHVAAAENRLEDVEAILEKEEEGKTFVNAGDDKMRRPLHLAAARTNSLEVMSMLIETGATYDITDSEGQTPVYTAAARGRVENVEMLVELGADLAIPETVRGWTPLHAAASGNHACVVKILLKNGAVIDALDNFGATALLVGVESKAEEAVAILLESGSDINIRDNNDKLPIWVAVQKDCLSIVKRLLSKGASVNYKDSRSSNLLFASSSNKTCDITKLLLEAGVDASAKRNDGRTALFNAILKGATSVACELVKHQADLDELDNETRNAPLHACAVKGLSEVAKVLVMHGANINLKGSNNFETPLQAAVRLKKINLTRTLIGLGADTSVRDEEGRSLVFRAIELNVPKLLEPFIQAGYDPNFTEAFGNTAFHFAVWNLNYEVFQTLVDAGGDIDRKNDDGLTPLHFASKVDVYTKADNAKVVKALIGAGAELEIENDDGCTALAVAYNPDSRGGKESDEVRSHWNSTRLELLKGGANPNAVWTSRIDDDGIEVPLLHAAAGMAASCGDVDCMKLLVQYGADVNKMSVRTTAQGDIVRKYTVLHTMMRQVYRIPSRNNATMMMNRNTVSMVELLLASGANVNAQDERGNTPLHVAVEAQNQHGVKMLLGHQGCTNTKNNDGVTPVDMALSLYSRSTPESQAVAEAFLTHIRMSR